MGQFNIALIFTCLVVVASGNVLPQGVDYSQYDPVKLQERYNIIQALVRPRASYRPKIGSAYSQKAYNKPVNYGYQPVTYAKQPVYKQPVYKQPVYKQPVYKQPVYAPAASPVVKNTGYAVGYNNPVRSAPVNYGYQGYGGVRFGGGQVHPVFNNDLLYKNNKALGPYDTTDPIFIGGGPTKAAPATGINAAPYRAQNSFGNFNNKLASPQIDAYGNNRQAATGYTYPYYG